jgi:hypothetical protein
MAIRYPVRLSRLGRGRPRLMDRPFSSPNPVDRYGEQTIAESLGYSQTVDQPPTGKSSAKLSSCPSGSVT